MKCPHCSNSKKLKQVDQKRNVGLILCLRCNKYFEVGDPPPMVQYTQSKLDIPIPKFKKSKNGNKTYSRSDGYILKHFLS